MLFRSHLSVDSALDADGYKTDNDAYSPISTELGYKSVHIPSLQGVRYYDPTGNELIDYYLSVGNSGNVYPTQGGQHAEGYIVDVYNDKIVLRTIDFAVLYYEADWTPRYEVEPIEDKVFELDTDILPVDAKK